MLSGPLAADAAAAGAEAELAADEAADAATGGERGVMRTPSLSIEMMTSSSFDEGPPASILTPEDLVLGVAGAAGGVGALGPCGAAATGVSSIISLHEVRNGGSRCSMPARIISSSESSAKRHQLMPTSQFAYCWNSRTALEDRLFQVLAAEVAKSDM